MPLEVRMNAPRVSMQGRIGRGSERLMRLFAVVLGLLTLVGCKRDMLTATLPPDVRVDTYTQQSASKIDVLWVVDNSGSMAPRQENLSKNFQAFIEVFTKGSVDYRLAVTTTDIFKERGRFVGTPKIITPQTPNAITAFAANVKVGVTGSPYEAGMEAGRLAIDTQRATNLAALDACKRACPSNQAACPGNCETNTKYEFLRDDAYLYIVFVSDEEDESSEDTRFYYRYFETAKGIGNDGMVTTAAIMGDVPGNSCGATPGVRYKTLSDLTGGDVGSICDANFANALRKLAANAVGLKRKFALQVAPNLQTLAVKLRYPCNASSDLTGPCASVDSTACKENPPESMNLLCTPKQGGADGWSYEMTNNVVYFSGESVPGLNAQVELQHYEEGKGP